MSDLRKLLDIVQENSDDGEPQIGDYVEIELGDTLLETYIEDITEDGVIIKVDETAIKLMINARKQLTENMQLSEYDEEYDDEAGMFKNDLQTIQRVSNHLEAAIKDNENLPEWCQAKISQAKGMIVSVMDYMISQHENGIIDTIDEEAKRGLWANIHAKRERIKHGSGERMRKPGSKGAPSAQDFKDSQKTSKNEGVAEGWGDYSSSNTQADQQAMSAAMPTIPQFASFYNKRNKLMGTSDHNGFHFTDEYMQHWKSQGYSKGQIDKMASTASVAQNLKSGNWTAKQGVAEGEMDEAKYQGREVPLGKPMAGDVKKSKVYVKKPNGKVVKVNFGDKNMRIKKSNPNRRKSFRARHHCENPGPRWKARYWSCRAW